MTTEDFITKVKQVVYESAISGTMSIIQKPPGRKPPESLIALSQWFGRLSDSDKATFESAIALAARQATFGVLAVLDGARQIEDTPDKGTLQLFYRRGDEATLLNPGDGEYLHDVFNRQVPPV